MKEHFVLNTPITSPKCASICQDWRLEFF
jgi:hypothetical protein